MKTPNCCRTAYLSVLTALVAGCAAARTTTLDQYLNELDSQGEFSGAVLVAEGERVLIHRAVGNPDADGERYTADGAYPIASVSKSLTATAMLQLVEEAAIGLDQPVGEVLVGFPYPRITLRHLLSHTSGLPSYNSFFDPVLTAHPDTSFSNADFLTGVLANPVPLRYEPGTAGNYDNINYVGIALVIERLSRMPYAEYIAERVLDPAGMRDTRFISLGALLRDSTSGSVFVPRMYTHRYSSVPVPASTIPYAVSYWNTYRFAGFGDYVSTTRDLFAR